MHAVSHSYWSLFCLQRWPSLHHFASTAFHKQQDWGTSTAAATTTPRCLAFSRAQESCRNSSPWKIHWCSNMFKTKLQTVKAAQITSIYKQNHPGVPNDLLELFLWNVTASIFVIGMKIFHHGLQHILSAQPISNSLATGRQRFQKYLRQNLRCRFPQCLK